MFKLISLCALAVSASALPNNWVQVRACPYLRLDNCSQAPDIEAACPTVQFDVCEKVISLPNHVYYVKYLYDEDSKMIIYQRYEDKECQTEQEKWSDPVPPMGKVGACIGPIDQIGDTNIYTKFFVHYDNNE